MVRSVSSRLELGEHELQVLFGGRLGEARELALSALERVELALDPRHVGVLRHLEAGLALGGDAAAHRRREQREEPRRAHAEINLSISIKKQAKLLKKQKNFILMFWWLVGYLLNI